MILLEMSNSLGGSFPGDRIHLPECHLSPVWLAGKFPLPRRRWLLLSLIGADLAPSVPLIGVKNANTLALALALTYTHQHTPADKLSIPL